MPEPESCPDPDVHEEKRSFIARAMSAKELILAITGLVVAIASIFRPQSTETARASYDELSKAVYEISAATGRNHDDVVAIRSYLAAMNGHPIPSTDYVPIALPSALIPRPNASTSSTSSAPPTTVIAVVPVPVAHSAPPVVGPKPPMVWIRPFDQVKK